MQDRADRRKYHFIYKTTNQITGKFYIGMHSTDNLEDGYVGSGKRLWYSINKYGKENHKFKILEFVEDRKMLSKREAEIVNEEFLLDPLCLNLKMGGDGGWDHTKDMDLKARNSKCNERFRQKMESDIEFKRKYQELSVKHLNSKKSHIKAFETKIERYGNLFGCSPWGKGQRHSEKSKKLIGEKTSQHQQGVGNSQFGTCWICAETETKKIKKEELQLWIELGWKIGRKY